MFNKLTAKNAGAKGGRAKTKLKGKTAQVNGRLGGRPPSRTLVERLLGRSILPEQQQYIDQALNDLFAREQEQIEEFFQVNSLYDSATNSAWQQKSRRVPKRIRYLIQKLRLAVNHYLREVPVPKPSVVEYRQRSVDEQEAWERGRGNSGVPCPPRRVSVDVRNLPYFDVFELKHKRGMSWTAEDMMEAGGGQWTKRRAEAAIKWLNATYPQDHS